MGTGPPDPGLTIASRTYFTEESSNTSLWFLKTQIFVETSCKSIVLRNLETLFHLFDRTNGIKKAGGAKHIVSKNFQLQRKPVEIN